MRLFSRGDPDVTVLVDELFVLAVHGTQFGNAIFEWIGRNQVEELAILSGIPMVRGPDEHRVFYIATDDYHGARLAGSDIPPMGRGFLNGTSATLVERDIGSPLGVGIYAMPVHAQAPDIETATRLTDAANEVYDLGVNSSLLESFAAGVQQYYTELAERLHESEADFPEDHMYM